MLSLAETPNFCLTTLALGSKYRRHCLNLIEDSSLLCPGVPMVVLTDRPDHFAHLENVIPVKHIIKSVGIYHDKLYCLEASLKTFEGCIFLDADCRLLTNVIESRNWKPGITAKSSQDLLKTMHRRIENATNTTMEKLVNKVASQYSIDLEEIKFINEIMFVVKKDGLKHEKFLSVWKEIRDLFESNRVFISEGTVIGLAARIAGLSIFHYDTGYPEEQEYHKIDDVYKDKLYLRRMDDLRGNLKDKILELDATRKEIERSSSNIGALSSRLTQNLAKETRFIKLILHQSLFKSI